MAIVIYFTIRTYTCTIESNSMFGSNTEHKHTRKKALKRL